MKKYRFIALKLILLSVFLFFIGRVEAVREMESEFYNGVEPVVKGLYKVSSDVREQFELVKSISTLLAEKRALEKKIEELSSCRSHLTELEIENNRLKNQLGLEIKGVSALLPTEVVVWEVIGNKQNFLVDKGSSQGIAKGLPVIHNGYFVGMVKDVFPGQAKVQAITDKNSRIPVVVEGRKETKGVVSGYMPGKLLMKKVLKDERLENGDFVVTAENELVPAGLSVGRVSHVRDEPLLKEAILKFPINLQNLSTVFIIKK